MPRRKAYTSADVRRAPGLRLLLQARAEAGLTLRELERRMRDAGGESASYAHLSKLETGERKLTRELAVAWGKATGREDPQGWAEQVIYLLGEQLLGRRRVVRMKFEVPAAPQVPDVLTRVPDVLRRDGMLSRLSSPEALVGRVTSVIGKAGTPQVGDDAPVILTAQGPVGDAFLEAAQTLAPVQVIADRAGSRRLVHLIAAPTPEETVQAVQQVLAASARIEEPGLYEPLITPDPADLDIVAVPGTESAIILHFPGGGYLWVAIPAEDYQHLGEYLHAALRNARDRHAIELVGFGTPVNEHWYSHWEDVLLREEEAAEERLFLQPHLGVLTMPAGQASAPGKQEASASGAEREAIDNWIRVRAERIAVFLRKLHKGECTYRDLASAQTLASMAEDGHLHVPGIHVPADTNNDARRERLRQAHTHLKYLIELLESQPAYELRLLPEDDDFPAQRLWSLVRRRSPGDEAVLTFTFSEDQKNARFVDAVVRDAEVAKRFREDFDQLWKQARGRTYTLQKLNQAIQQLQRLIDQIGDLFKTLLGHLHPHTSGLRESARFARAEWRSAGPSRDGRDQRAIRPSAPTGAVNETVGAKATVSDGFAPGDRMQLCFEAKAPLKSPGSLPRRPSWARLPVRDVMWDQGNRIGLRTAALWPGLRCLMSCGGV